MVAEQIDEASANKSTGFWTRVTTFAVLPLLFVLLATAIQKGWLSSAAATPDTVTNPGNASGNEFVFAGADSSESVEASATQRLMMFSVESTTRFADDLDVANEDIVCTNGTDVWTIFDGSDVGLAGSKISGFTFAAPSQILLSFSGPTSLPGFDRIVQPTDVVSFYGEQLGAETSGSFSLYFVGNNAGLNTTAEHIDALHVLPDGRLLISTVSSFSVPGAKGNDEDLLAFTGHSWGSETSGDWQIFLDGSDVGWSGQDVDALSVDASGNIYLSSNESFNPAMGPVADNDVMLFMPTSLGADSAGTYAPHVVMAGAELVEDLGNIRGIHLPDNSLHSDILRLK